jgi:acetyltransferase-like isoleucine patch superfamily enzyme
MEEDAFSVNRQELMDYYKLSGNFGRLKLYIKFINSWVLHSLAFHSPLSDFSISMQRKRGVKIGKNCHFTSYVLIDLIYPQLVTIEDNVTISHNVMIFAHMNPTANLHLKNTTYPRKVEKVTIKKGAVINPGAIITAGVTVGENSIISVGSVISQDVPDNCVVVGNPARVVKKI